MNYTDGHFPCQELFLVNFIAWVMTKIKVIVHLNFAIIIMSLSVSFNPAIRLISIAFLV